MSNHILVIVESPAKCKKIESYLGNGYKVISSFGHLRNISGLESIDIKNNFNPSYSIINDEFKIKQVDRLSYEIARCKEVIIATDDDREGEAIGWHICDLFGLPINKTKRIIFHEITEIAIKNAILKPKYVSINLVQAQQARQILDLLVGYTISPILWKFFSKTHEGSLSAGRCQTPALRLVYENYLDIKNSPGKFVYNTYAYFTTNNILFELDKQFENDKIVKEFLELCKSWNFNYSLTNPKKTIKKSPEPLTTSTLQQLASNELHMSPKETMKYAQQLYENGYITYMRTDSKKYSQEFINNIKKYIGNNYGEEYISQNINNLVCNKELKKTKISTTQKENVIPQEAHEAIRPVNINIQTLALDDTVNLDIKSLKLYYIIWKRALETCISSSQYNYIIAKISAPLGREFIYRAEQVIFLGWQIVGQIVKKELETNKYYQFFQNLKQNTVIKPKKIDCKFAIIELKTHYTEAKLVQLLEEKGIGRPSTFASLIDKIQERKYVEKQNIQGQEIESIDYLFENNNILQIINKREFGNEQNKLVIQPLGILVIEYLLEKFDTFFNYDYTKIMEDSLDEIANGKLVWHNLCKKCYDNLISLTDKLELNKFNIKIDEYHYLIIGKYGPVVKYINGKNINFIPVKKDFNIENFINNYQYDNLNKNIKLAPKLEDIVDINFNEKAIGKYKGKDLFIKNGKYGIYAQWGKETKSLKEEFNKIKIEDINYIDVIKFLDKDIILDPNKPVGLVRELTNSLTIRTGKYGDYIFYKKSSMKKPEFYKLNGFNDDYKKCDKNLLINWIKETHKIK